MEKSNDMSKSKKFLTECWFTVRYPLLYAGITLLVGVIYIAILSIIDEFSGGNDILPEDRIDEMLVMLISASIALVVIWRLIGKEWKATGFWRYEQLTPKLIAVCVLLAIALNSFVNGLLYLLADLPDEADSDFLIIGDLGNPIIIFLAANLAVPLIEEVLIRGIVLEYLKKIKLNIKLALVIQAFIFALYHTGGVQITYSFALGIILGLIYLWSGTIWVPLIVHIVFNIFTDVFGLFFDIGNSGVAAPFWAICAFIGLAASVILLKYLKRYRIESANSGQEAKDE